MLQDVEGEVLSTRPGAATQSCARLRANLVLAAVCAGLVLGALGAAIVARARWERHDVTVPILMYHKIGPKAYTNYWVSGEDFDAQMKALYDHGYRTVPLVALHEYREGKRKLPRRPVAITFDDGYENNYTIAYPVLKKFGFTATVFLLPPLVGDDEESRKDNSWDGPGERIYPARHLIWPEVLKMAEGGIEFGAHTMTHPDLAQLNNSNVDRELVESKHIIETRLGRPVDSLCYPHGARNDRVVEEVRKAGYRVAVTSHGSIVHMGSAKLLELERIAIIGGKTSMVFTGEPTAFFMSRVDPDFQVPRIEFVDIHTETISGERSGRFRSGDGVRIRVRVRNAGGSQVVVPELGVQPAASSGLEAAAASHLRLKRRRLPRGSTQEMTFLWRMPRPGAAAYRMRVVFRDSSGALCFHDTGLLGEPVIERADI